MLVECGITLYLMLDPPKYLIYNDKLAAGVTAKHAAGEVALYKEFSGELGGVGVKVIDLLPKLLEQRDQAT